MRFKEKLTAVVKDSLLRINLSKGNFTIDNSFLVVT